MFTFGRINFSRENEENKIKKENCVKRKTFGHDLS